MSANNLARIMKAVRYDVRNLVYPFLHPRYLLQGIFLFNGNRILRHPSARIDKEGGRLQFGCFWDLWKSKGGIVLHENACLRIRGNVVIGDGVTIEVHAGASLEIGPETFINPHSRIIALESIRIGADCAVAWDVQIMDGDRHFFFDGEGGRVKNTAAIRIGDHVWIGARSLILKGASIEDGAVVGAGSVVSGHVGAGTVVAGNPAGEIRGGVRWEK
jgi:acetyltransferase-like isoleucine patch superfamily enzyme